MAAVGSKVVSLVLIFVFLGVLSTSFGAPELSSSTSSLELSGVVCPDYIMLTCTQNTTERVFEWFANDDRLARFDEGDTIPFTVKTRPDLFNATVQVTSVVEVNGYYSFDKFTLTARVSDFLPLQGQNLTCGTLLDRSEPFRVNDFFIDFKNAENVSIMTVHNDDNEELSVKWNITSFKCAETNFSFVGTLKNGTNQLFETTTTCSVNCEVNFPLVSSEGSYIIEVSPLNGQGEKVGDTVVRHFNASAADETQSSSYELTQSACIVSINCISPRAGNCLIKIADQTETIVPINETYNFQDLTPNIIYWFNITFVELSFVMENNNFSIQGSCSQSSKEGLIVGVVVAVIALCLIIAVALVVYRKYYMRDKTFCKRKEELCELEAWEDEKNVKTFTFNYQGDLVDEKGNRVAEDIVNSGHRCIGESMEKARTRIPEERLQYMRNLRKDQDPIIEDSHVYDETQFPNTISTGQSETAEALGEEDEKNYNKYAHLHDQRKIIPSQQDGNLVVYSGLNPTEMEGYNRLKDNNNATFNGPQEEKNE